MSENTTTPEYLIARLAECPDIQIAPHLVPKLLGVDRSICHDYSDGSRLFVVWCDARFVDEAKAMRERSRQWELQRGTTTESN